MKEFVASRPALEAILILPAERKQYQMVIEICMKKGIGLKEVNIKDCINIHFTLFSLL